MELSAYSQDGNITLYFILPRSCRTEEECSKLLKYAYQACREHELEPSWLPTDDCIKMIPTKQDVFVADPFEGDAFDHLLSGGFKCVRVLGPRCLLTCLHSKKPVPELPSPLHNMAMHDIVITSTGFDKEEKIKLQDLVERMCGIYSNSFHDGITHLLAKTVGTKKYMVAVEKEIPVMTDEWVKTVWKALHEETDESIVATQEQFIKFTCPVFKGLVICTSQLPRHEKDTLRSLIEVNGGTYTANLEMSITSVLVTAVAEGEKYKAASQWRIPCITQDWIRDSIEKGYALPYDEYKTLRKNKASTPTKEHSVTRALPDMSACSTILNESALNSGSVVDETTEQDFSLILRKPPTNPRISAGLSALEHLDLQQVYKAGQFLDGCKVFTLGFEGGALGEKLRRIFNAGGATRFNNLTDGVTHVVVGKHIEEQITAIESWSAKPTVVTADWVVECVKEKRIVDHDRFLYSRNDHASKGAFENTSKGINARVDETNDATFIDEELMNQYLGEKQAPAVRESSLDYSSLPDSQQPTFGGIFKGCNFTVSGYPENIEEDLVDLIQENGGGIVDIKSTHTVHFSILSVEGEGVSHPKALNIITHIFLEDCLEKAALLPVEYFHMPFAWPSDSSLLSGCVVATSIYTGKERPFITHLATTMGAVYQDLFAKKDNIKKGVQSSTHLLCPQAEGSKFAAAEKWGVPTVTKDWVLASAEKGIRAPEKLFSVRCSPPTVIDCKGVLLSLLKKAGKLPGVSGAISTPVNWRVQALKSQNTNDAASQIKTPDIDTIRKMYPTPGGPSNNDSLDEMSTPETPYGRTWYSNPPPRVRKGMKRAIDALPDSPAAKRIPDPETPMEVYMQRFTNKLKDIVANHPPPKPPPPPKMGCLTPGHNENETVTENQNNEHKDDSSRPADHVGVLSGVVVYSSRKLAESQQELYQAVAEMGGDYRWTYDSSVTHFLHYGRLNDTNKEFRIAKEGGKIIVAPDWIWMCQDEGKRIDEALFPHVHNPKMSLSLVSTKSTPLKRRKGMVKSKTARDESEAPEEIEEDDGVKSDLDLEGENPDRLGTKEALARQLEELENLASVQGAGARRTPIRKSAEGASRVDTPSNRIEGHRGPSANTESESQGTAITWDDPKDREARLRLEGAIVGETQDIIAQKQQITASDIRNKENDSQTMNSERRVPSRYVFSLSGMKEEEREEYHCVISRLGGSVIDSKNFDPSITHIVTMRPSRSEKHLSAIASGKWVLYKTFLDASNEAGYFVDEQYHEWGNELSTLLPNLPEDGLESKIAAAAHRWRRQLEETNNKAFDGMKIALYSSKERMATLTRFIEAGGGMILRNAKDEDYNQVTHCFVEMSKTSKVDLALFAARQIPCMHPMFLNNFLIEYPPPDEMENCIPEYNAVITNMTSAQKNFSRRNKK